MLEYSEIGDFDYTPEMVTQLAESQWYDPNLARPHLRKLRYIRGMRKHPYRHLPKEQRPTFSQGLTRYIEFMEAVEKHYQSTSC